MAIVPKKLVKVFMAFFMENLPKGIKHSEEIFGDDTLNKCKVSSLLFNA